MSKRMRSWAGAGVVALVVAGCGTTTVNPVGGQYWLVRVKDGYASIYRYPKGSKPGAPASDQIYLGTTPAEKDANLRAAAQRLHVPMNHIQNEVGA